MLAIAHQLMSMIMVAAAVTIMLMITEAQATSSSLLLLTSDNRLLSEIRNSKGISRRSLDTPPAPAHRFPPD